MPLDELDLWFLAENEDMAYASRRRTAAWLRVVLRASALVVAATAFAAAATHPQDAVWWIYGLFAISLGAAFLLEARKRMRHAGLVLSLGFWTAATAAVCLLGGVRSPGAFVYLPVIITAGLFCSRRAAVGIAIASLVAVLLASVFDPLHVLSIPERAPSLTLLLPVYAGSLTMTLVLVAIALSTLHGALKDVRQQALRNEELLLNAPDVLAVIDRLGVVVGVAPAMRDRLGYEPSELIGKHVSRVELFGPDGRAVVDDIRLLGTRASEGARELSLRSRDGARSWGEVRLLPTPTGKSGTHRRIVLCDVTRRHTAEARQAELEKRMEQGRRLERMGLIAGGVAHDFNNQLTVILSLGSVLDTRLPTDSPERQLLMEINHSAVRAAELARDLLAVKPKRSAEAMDVARELTTLQPMLSRMAGSAVKLSVRGRTPCFVQIEKAELERIATNLVINARDAMPSGGEVVIAVTPSVGGAGGSARRMIEISVTDCGVGMDTLTRQRILEPFFTTKGEAGTGLGLSTVDGIVSRLGGRLLVKSERGRGTEIRILLPEAEVDDVNPQPSTAFGTPPG